MNMIRIYVDKTNKQVHFLTIKNETPPAKSQTGANMLACFSKQTWRS